MNQIVNLENSGEIRITALYRTLNCTKRLLGIIEREFIENLYNTGLTDQKNDIRKTLLVFL